MCDLEIVSALNRQAAELERQNAAMLAACERCKARARDRVEILQLAYNNCHARERLAIGERLAEARVIQKWIGEEIAEAIAAAEKPD